MMDGSKGRRRACGGKNGNRAFNKVKEYRAVKSLMVSNTPCTWCTLGLLGTPYSVFGKSS